MIERTIKEKIISLAAQFPVVSLTGVRQSGKSTLLKNCFPDYTYVSLEDIDIQKFAIDDPRGFLLNFGRHLIIDEAQLAPALFSYIKTDIDNVNEAGMYLLSGSQNFLLMENVSQSLAGRTAVLDMSPLSIEELKRNGTLPVTLNDMLFTGGYPRIYDKLIAPADYFPSYIRTYVERDVRQLRNIGNRQQFMKFIRLCAGRVGQLFNITSFANEADLSLPTLRAWISVLETCGVVFLLQPYHKNFNKRIVKSPKLYFCDTGLLSSLLGIRDVVQVETHYMRGEIFENLIVSELRKKYTNRGIEPYIYFWRDSNGNEVDIIEEDNGKLNAYEIKSSATLRHDFFKGIDNFAKVAGDLINERAVVYGGDDDFAHTAGSFISWRNWGCRLR
ncbi:MAG: ATP-binding protein [Bacteroidales bacterium]|nr:ATP-binding protein [Bacteroidales bacterium]